MALILDEDPDAEPTVHVHMPREQENIDLYRIPIDGVEFSKACGGNTHPDGEPCVTLARIGPASWALGDSKRPDAEPLRFTTAELDAAGIDPARFDLSA